MHFNFSAKHVFLKLLTSEVNPFSSRKEMDVKVRKYIEVIFN